MELLFVLLQMTIYDYTDCRKMIPSTGVESAPADILAWSLVKRVREDLSAPTRQIDSTIKEMKYVTRIHRRDTYLTHLPPDPPVPAAAL
jgi:hypothetical protein